MNALVGAAIQGGVSLIGGLLGQSSARDRERAEKEALRGLNRSNMELTAEMNRQVRARADAAARTPVVTTNFSEGHDNTQGGVDMDAFLAASARGGFNPLTFLRSGALGLFGTTRRQTGEYSWSRTTGERAMEAALAGQYIPTLVSDFPTTQVPGTGEIIGNALSAGAGTYLDWMASDKANAAAMERQLASQAQRGGAGALSLGARAPGVSYGSATRSGGSGALAKSFSQSSGPVKGNKLVLHNLPDLSLPHGPEGSNIASNALGELGEFGVAADTLISNARNRYHGLLDRLNLSNPMAAGARHSRSGKGARIGPSSKYNRAFRGR